MFYDILKRENAFLRYENNKFKKSKYWHFSKGVSPIGFCPKLSISPPYLFRNIGQENVFYDILERKNALLGYKNNNLKKSKN